MKIIGLTGLARSGKDTACGFILEWAEENGIIAKRASFAEKLKISAARSLGLPGVETPEQCVTACENLKHMGTITITGSDDSIFSFESVTISGREFLQRYGTEAHRDVFGDDFWVDALMQELRRDTETELAVITDTRFPNEAVAVRHGAPWGEVWEIVRPEAGLSEGLEAHASEAGVGGDKIDLSLDNSGDLDEFKRLVYLACEARQSLS